MTMTGEWNLPHVISIARRRWKTIGGVSLVVGVLTYLLLGLIPPLYEAEAIFYPANPRSVSSALLGEGSGSADFLSFGTDEVVEQFLQILGSASVIEGLVRRFDLAHHYRIDMDRPFARKRLIKAVKKHIKVRRTQFSSIAITVSDPSPDTAALLANTLMMLADSIKSALVQQRARAAFAITQKHYEEKHRQVQKIVDSLQALGRMGVLNYEEQSASYAEAWAAAVTKGNIRHARQIEEKIRLLGEYGPIQHYLSKQLTFELEALSLLKQQYEKLRMSAFERISTIFVIDRASPPDQPAWPPRLLLTLAAMCLTAGAMLALFLIVNRR